MNYRAETTTPESFKTFAQQEARIAMFRRKLTFIEIERRYGFKANTVCKTFCRHFGTDHRFKPNSQGARILEILHMETGIPPISPHTCPNGDNSGREPKKQTISQGHDAKTQTA